MMKSISKIICSVAALLLAGNLFAVPVCLPIATIKNAIFTKAIQSDLMNENEWGMLTDNFNYDGKMWNIGFVTKLENIKTPEEALQKGQAIFHTVNLMPPEPFQWDGRFECIYTLVDNDTPFVAAFTPPITPPNNFKKIGK